MRESIQHLRNFIRKGLTNIMFNRFVTKLTPQGVAIDCGANVGEISIKIAKTGARLYAFEPNPFAYKRLHERIGGYDNVTCINKGVWDRNCVTKFYFHRDSLSNEELWSFASSIFRDKSNVDSNRSIEVEMVDLIEFIQKLDQPVDLLKIDIEGAECEVLDKFLNNNLQNQVKLTLVETHDKKIPGLKEKTDAIRKVMKEKDVDNVRLSWL